MKLSVKITYTLLSGVKGTMELPIALVRKWINQFTDSEQTAFKTEEYIGHINPKLIADFRIEEGGELENLELEQKEIEKNTSQPLADELVHGEPDQVPFRINCICSATYIATLYIESTEAVCKYCKRKVYVDYSKGVIATRFGEGFKMTNLYNVNSDQKKPKIEL
ncbi:hypothetical protein L2089_15525 [Paenibacillus hunanensis]|uniref:hypothetical protein n=1 Tax=Paenibacillus hunanensis TaxID=539262 RepID=UPI002025F1DA|nr:hypothetical protein [Paenibacillus hunanensis]MCL9662104.1 hypothetical protein [Paenibacillus hunanensis]